MKFIKPAAQFFRLILVILLFSNSVSAQPQKQTAVKDSEQWVCLPCGNNCDTEIHSGPGKCAHCQMALVKKSTITFKTIEPAEICNYIKKHPAVVLLDVRTKEEFEGRADPNFGTLKNAINIPIQELEKRLPEISTLKKKEIIVYCSHSHRSPQASYLLTQNGFMDVTNLAGGMSVMKDKECEQ